MRVCTEEGAERRGSCYSGERRAKRREANCVRHEAAAHRRFQCAQRGSAPYLAAVGPGGRDRGDGGRAVGQK